MIIAEYIWLDGNNKFRSKIRVLEDNIIPDWNYDGSSTYQSSTNNSEIILKPVRIFSHPLYDESTLDCFIIVCEIYSDSLINNTRHNADIIFNMKLDEEPWFGLEQEYFLYSKNNIPLGYNKNVVQGEYYCNTIKQDILGEKIVNKHLIMCIKAGIKISGINAEVAPGQWEFQIGPCVGIEAGDHMMAARFLLEKIAIQEGVYVEYHPKPFENINGSGCHVNFSTLKMREDNGYNVIIDSIKKLEISHNKHMKIYGDFNKLRMTGHHETASYNEFTYGVGSRNTSIRIGYETHKNQKGYFEDRRPASNIDPYIVTSMIFETCILN